MHGHGALPCAMCAEFREQRERRCALAHIAKTLNSESSRTRAARAFLHSLGFRRSVALQETNCCDNSDCRPARYRITSSGVEMLVGETGFGCLAGSSSTACWRATPERLSEATGAASGTKRLRHVLRVSTPDACCRALTGTGIVAAPALRIMSASRFHIDPPAHA